MTTNWRSASRTFEVDFESSQVVLGHLQRVVSDGYWLGVCGYQQLSGCVGAAQSLLTIDRQTVNASKYQSGY